MDSNLRQAISSSINTSLQNMPEYNSCNFVEDSLQINNIINTELRNQSDFKLCLNKLRVILRDNKPLFCSLFINLLPKYLSLLSSENMVPEEYLFVLIDIIHNHSQIKKYYNKWIEEILSSLINFYVSNAQSKSIEQINKLCLIIEFLFEDFVSCDEDSINNFILLFKKNNIKIQKMSALLFFKYIYRYDINKIKLIDWKLFFETCVDVLDNNLKDEENKTEIQNIFKQLLSYFNKLNVDPNDVLIKAKSFNGAKYFQMITGFNMEKSKNILKEI